MDLEKLLLSGLPLVFAIFWLVLLHFIAWAGGWTRLARTFTDDGTHIENPVRRRGFQSGSFGWMNYGSCLNIATYEDGIRVAVLWPFRPGHAPLFIPWSAFHEPRLRRVFPFLKRLEVHVGTPPVKVLLPAWVGDKVSGER